MQLRSPACGAIAVLAAFFASPPAAAQGGAPTVTFVVGASTLISDANGYLPAPGVPLRQCDIVRTGPQALVQVELEDGTQIVLGPESGLLFGLPHAGEATAGTYFLTSGWVKITVPKRDKLPPQRINSPHVDMVVDAGIAVLRAGADSGQFFVEQGNSVALVPGGRAADQVAVGAGRTYSRKAGQEGAAAKGADPAFVEGMPRSLRDTLPSLLTKLQARDVRPKPAPDFNQAEAKAWMNAIPQIRPCFGDVTVRSAQEALERNGIKVGPIDGILGPRTEAALRKFQQDRGLTPSGQLDQETRRALAVAEQR